MGPKRKKIVLPMPSGLAYVAESIGFWGWYSVGYWISYRLFLYAGDLWWLNYFGFCGVACILFAVMLWRFRLSKFITRTLDIGLCLAGLASVAILSNETWASNKSILIVVAIFAGAFLAWVVSRWGTHYASKDAREDLTCMLVGIICISVVKVATGLLPAISPYLIGVIAAATTVALRGKDVSRQNARLQEPYTMRTFFSLWQTLLAIIVFFVLWSFLNVALNLNVGHFALAGSSSPWQLLLAQAIDIGFSVFMLHWTVRLKRSIDWTFFWQVAYFCLGIGLLAMSLFGATSIVQVFLSASSQPVFIFLIYFLIRLARRSAYAPSVVISGGYAIISILDWSVRSFVTYFHIVPQNVSLSSVLLFVILFVIVFLLPARSPGMQFLTSEISKRERVSKASDMQRCSALAKKCKLTARELDTLMLLIRGRSTPYIAETLYLSENTVKTYRRRIYAKLGIHNKQELIDLIEQDRRPPA